MQDRAALTSGDFSSLNISFPAIDEIVSDLETGQLTADEPTRKLLDEVQKLATRNASLLLAGIEGTRAAKEKIDMIRRATSQLNTYTSDGSVKNVNPEAGTVEKRA